MSTEEVKSPTEDVNSHGSAWFCLAAFSTIAIVAVLKSFEGDLADQEKETKWATSAISINLFMSAMGVFINMIAKKRFSGTRIEGMLALLIFAFWAACLPTIMNPDNNLAVQDITQAIMDGNLYFFSWGGFLTSFYILGRLMSQKKTKSSDFKASMWGALMTTSFIAMISASRFYDDWRCDEDQPNDILEDKCKRTKLAVSVSTISVIISLVWMFLGSFLSGKIGAILDALLGVVVLVFWCFAVAYVTFGDDRTVATHIGNLYFFTWGSFALSVALTMSGYERLTKKKDANAPQEPAEEKAEGEGEAEGDKQKEKESEEPDEGLEAQA